MILKALSIRNFRNIASADFVFHPKVNVFTGNNAQGKTNLCEAVSICLGKSFRSAKPNEITPFGLDPSAETSAELYFSFDSNDRENRILYVQKGGSVKLTFNGLELKKAEELYGALRYVSFIPEDLYIVKGNPEKRRDYLDFVSNMINRVHNVKLYEYNKALKQKNNLLAKSDFYDNSALSAMLESWNETLARLGVNVMCGRLKYFNILTDYAKKYYEKLNQNNEILSVEYDSTIMRDIPYSIESVELMYNTYLQRLAETAERERRMKYTVVGAHRDDLFFKINNMNARDFGSQGQVRSIAIALKLAEAKMIYEKSGDFPVIILDDVLSELDLFRRSFIINHIDKLQTFITSCNMSDMDKVSDGAVWNVEKGQFVRV